MDFRVTSFWEFTIFSFEWGGTAPDRLSAQFDGPFEVTTALTKEQVVLMATRAFEHQETISGYGGSTLVIHALNTWMDYCNVLYKSLPLKCSQKLQLMQNEAVQTATAT